MAGLEGVDSESLCQEFYRFSEASTCVIMRSVKTGFTMSR